MDKDSIKFIPYAAAFLLEAGYKTVNFRENRGWVFDQDIHSDLIESGIKNGSCCREYVFSLDRS